MASIPSDLLPRARQILLPLVTSEDEREALLIEAFYSDAAALYSGIDRSGAPKIFAVNCLKKLMEYGTLAEGEHSLARLLRIAAIDCGNDKQAEIAALIAMANLCHQTDEEPLASILPAVATPAPVLTINTPRQQRPTSVFISYERHDTELARQLIADLGQAGHACWIDTTAIKGGDEWVDTIVEGIRNSYALVIVVTATALASSWVQNEIIWAANRKKPIIPVVVEDVMQEDRFILLVAYQAIKLFETGYPAALQKLLASLPSAEAALTAPLSQSPQLDQRKLELSYLERLRLEELLNTEKYTPLGGIAQQQGKRAEMRAVFELLPMSKERELLRASHRFENAVEEILQLRRAVLLGEPGGGKTTTIWKLAADLVTTAVADRQAPLPLLIRLGRWTEAEQSLPAFIATQLGELGAYLPELLKENRAALLLDGLNELPTGQRQEKYPQVQRFIEEHPKLLAIVSCRELDYTLDLGFDRINITPLDPLRMREFVERYLGEERGAALFWKLAGEAAREQLARFNQEFSKQLPEPERVFWNEPQLPAGVSWGYNWGNERNDNSFWQDWLRMHEKPSSLMVLACNPYMLLMLTSVYAEQGKLPENRADLFRLFVQKLLNREQILAEEQARLTTGLAQVAYKMQTHRAQDEIGDALTVLPKDAIMAYLDERLLYLAGSASLLSVGEQVRFTHQLLQEYFVAKGMEDKLPGDQLRAVDIWPPARWWERTNWEEAAILLAGLHSDDCTMVVDWVARGNPEVAAQCIMRSGAALAPTTQERLRAEWIARLTAVQDDPQPASRAAVGRALSLTGWDNRKGVGVVTNASGVILPDIDWVKIPGGEFQYGSEEPNSAQPQKVTLPPFEISRYPITYTQFQTFLDDPDGYADPRWFEGMAADENDRRMREPYFKYYDYPYTNHPRESVNWYQAMAFCRWLSWRTGGGSDLNKINEWAIRLPTEFEWEKAARATDGRLYPYAGDYDPAKSNTRESSIRQTSAVGIFPQGASPYGVEEMCGNVWEWCLSNFDNSTREVWQENLRTADNRVLRGGSWDSHGVVSAALRLYYTPHDRVINAFGFRVSRELRPPAV